MVLLAQWGVFCLQVDCRVAEKGRQHGVIAREKLAMERYFGVNYEGREYDVRFFTIMSLLL